VRNNNTHAAAAQLLDALNEVQLATEQFWRHLRIALKHQLASLQMEGHQARRERLPLQYISPTAHLGG
jgi:hypothetical protein